MRDKWRSRVSENNQLPPSLDAARTAALWELHPALDLPSDAFIHGDGGLGTVRLDVVEDRVAVVLSEEGPLQPHGLSHLAQRGGSAPGEVRLDLFVRDAGTWIIQCFLHLSAEPRIIRSVVIG
jgi:hypothetical protein